MNPNKLRVMIDDVNRLIEITGNEDVRKIHIEKSRVFQCVPSPYFSDGDSSPWFYEILHLTQIPGYYVGTYVDGNIFYMATPINTGIGAYRLFIMK